MHFLIDLAVHVVNCGKPASTPSLRPSADVMPCPVCQITFAHLDDLQVHMLVQHPELQENL